MGLRDADERFVTGVVATRKREADAEKVLDLMYEEQDEEELRALLKRIDNPTAVVATVLGWVIDRYQKEMAHRLHVNLMTALVD